MRHVTERNSSCSLFYRELAELTDRVTALHMNVGSLEGYYYLFGSWRIMVFAGCEAVRFFWDGREYEMSVDISPTKKLSAPNEWRRELAAGLHRESDSPHQFVVDFLTKRFWAEQSASPTGQ